MNWAEVATRLFPQGHDIVAEGSMLRGTGTCGDLVFTVIGTTDHVEMGVEQALAMARGVLDTVHTAPRRPILFLVDTQGQRLRHRDELLGINRVMSHLAQCVELARRSGHKVLALVYDQALSGGFIASGMMADTCGALPDAEIRVMNLPAMARVTRIAEDRLRELAADSPVFAPGAVNYVTMGAVDALWDGDLAHRLRAVLADATPGDRRRELGFERGGRKLAARIVEQVVHADVDARPAAVGAG